MAQPPHGTPSRPRSYLSQRAGGRRASTDVHQHAGTSQPVSSPCDESSCHHQTSRSLHSSTLGVPTPSDATAFRHSWICSLLELPGHSPLLHPFNLTVLPLFSFQFRGWGEQRLSPCQGRGKAFAMPSQMPGSLGLALLGAHTFTLCWPFLPFKVLFRMIVARTKWPVSSLPWGSRGKSIVHQMFASTVRPFLFRLAVGSQG